MKTFVVFCLAVNFALGTSLQCYSCPEGASGKCETIQECNNGDNSCLKLDSGETTYTKCTSYANCDFMTLAANTGLNTFSFSCCQNDLCNGIPKKGLLERFMEKLGFN